MIFGNEAPKIIYDPTGTPVEILLDYVVIEKDEPEEDFLIHQSIFTGHREFILKGKYWVVEMKLHVYKLGVEAGLEYYNTLKQYSNNLFRYFRHRDGDYLKDSTGAEIEMFLEYINESYYSDVAEYPDYLLLRFRSTKYIDLTQGVS